MSSPESSFTRREFLQTSARVIGSIVVGGAGTALGVNEITKGKEGIVRVEQGNFIPLYEEHTVGISTERFPTSIDALFRETSDRLKSIEKAFTNNPQKASSRLTSETSRPNMDDIILNLSEHNAPLVFGDIRTSQHDFIQYGLVVPYAEELIGLAAFLVLLKLRNPTRRKLLRLALGAVAFYGLSNIIDLIPIPTSDTDNPEWITRVNRISGITSHTHPEQPLVFIRNAIMANKLLLTGDYLKEKLGRKPDIAFWVGVDHSGIEDFLQAGPDVCRKVITLYPKPYLQHIIDDAGGSEDFSSALLAYPRSTSDGQYVYDIEKTTDRKLMARL